MDAASLILGASVGVVALFLVSVRRAFGPGGNRAAAWAASAVALWCGGLAAVAGAPVFYRNDVLPPPFTFVFLAVVSLGIWLGYGPVGRRIASAVSTRWLVLFHTFRFAAEAGLYAAYVEGIGPVQMTVLGNNKDVVTAIAALVVGLVPALYRSRRVLIAFNVLGLLNLAVIAVTAALSMPSPFRAYLEEPSQAWVCELPYIYLPGILVVAAFAGHFALMHALPRRSDDPSGEVAPAA